VTWSGRTLVASPAVYLSPDDAKTDVILAAAAAVFGLTLRGFVASLPLYPRTGLAGAVLELIWVFVLTALVPILLARYRKDGAAAFGFTGGGGGRRIGPGGGAIGPGGGIGRGVVLAVPAVLVGAGLQALNPIGGLGALLGRLAGPVAAGSAVELAYAIGQVALLSLGALVLVGFVATRSRDGFPRSPETSLTQLIRTIGLGAVGVAFVGGLLRTLTGGGSLVFALGNVLALAAILLLTDRMVPTGLSVPRTAVAAPVVVVLVAQVFAAGGLFRGDLLFSLTAAALAAGVTIAIASLAQTRDGVIVAVPLVIAVHYWPTCLSPLVLAGC
jgi:hypothetical protein